MWHVNKMDTREVSVERLGYDGLKKEQMDSVEGFVKGKYVLANIGFGKSVSDIFYTHV